MKRLSFTSLSAALMMSASVVYALDFPQAPPNQKVAESQGLVRLDVSELTTLFQSAVIADQAQGGRCKFIYHTDGSVERMGGLNKPGQWRIDESKNVYCKSFHRKKGYSENCFAVYRAPDNIHYFDYDSKDGLFAQVWRCSKEK